MLDERGTTALECVSLACAEPSIGRTMREGRMQIGRRCHRTHDMGDMIRRPPTYPFWRACCLDDLITGSRSRTILLNPLKGMIGRFSGSSRDFRQMLRGASVPRVEGRLNHRPVGSHATVGSQQARQPRAAVADLRGTMTSQHGSTAVAELDAGSIECADEPISAASAWAASCSAATSLRGAVLQQTWPPTRPCQEGRGCSRES